MAFFTSTSSGNGAPAWIQHVFNRDLAALRSSIDAAVTEYESVRRKVLQYSFILFLSIGESVVKRHFNQYIIQSRPTSHMSPQEYGYQRERNPSAYRPTRSGVERAGK